MELQKPRTQQRLCRRDFNNKGIETKIKHGDQQCWSIINKSLCSKTNHREFYSFNQENGFDVTGSCHLCPDWGEITGHNHHHVKKNWEHGFHAMILKCIAVLFEWKYQLLFPLNPWLMPNYHWCHGIGYQFSLVAVFSTSIRLLSCNACRARKGYLF